MHGKAVVVGVGETTYYKHGQSPDTEFQLACAAIQRAAVDAGLPLSEIDGLISYMDQRNSPLRVAGALGMKELRWSSTPWDSSTRIKKSGRRRSTLCGKRWLPHRTTTPFAFISLWRWPNRATSLAQNRIS